MKNKNLISNISSIIVGVLIYIFMSCAHVVVDLGVLGQASANGYDMLGEGTPALIGIGGYILVILAAVMILAGIIGLLMDFKVFSNEKFAKILSIILFVVNIVVAVASILVVIGIAVEEMRIGWAAIINMVITMLAAALSIFGVVKTKKSK